MKIMSNYGYIFRHDIDKLLLMCIIIYFQLDYYGGKDYEDEENTGNISYLFSVDQ